jgi:hypothetical protein
MLIDDVTYKSETGHLPPLKILFDYCRKKLKHGDLGPIANLDIHVQCVDAGSEYPLQY